MIILNFIKEYWAQFLFLITIIFFIINWIKATKCSLRNDILQIYSNCRKDKQITLYELEAISLSYGLYKKIRGNSFVDSIYKEVQTWEKL